MKKLQFLIIFFCWGCASGPAHIKGLQNLASLQKIVEEALPQGLLKTSSNGRTFFSNYFVILNGFHKPARGGEKLRYQARVLISGSQPPYNIVISVRRQEFKRGRYLFVGQEKKIVRSLKRRIQSKLNLLQKNKNVIENFRAF